MSAAAEAASRPEALAGQRLHEFRKERGWSQQEVADRMAAYGYSWHQTTIAKLEAGVRPLRINELVNLALLFGMRPAAFIGSAPAPARPCPTCGFGPPAGFTCNTCGRPG